MGNGPTSALARLTAARLRTRRAALASGYAKLRRAIARLAPSIALGDPAHFQYRRAHSLFWVARSTQLTRLARGPLPHEPDDIPCFRCKQLEPLDDRQPLTSRTARLTRAAGERLAASVGEDVSGREVWWRLLADVPAQLRTLARLYQLMPKEGVAKLRLL